MPQPPQFRLRMPIRDTQQARRALALSIFECIRSSNLSKEAIMYYSLVFVANQRLLSLGPDSEARKDALKRFIRRCAILSALPLIENFLLLYKPEPEVGGPSNNFTVNPPPTFDTITDDWDVYGFRNDDLRAIYNALGIEEDFQVKKRWFKGQPSFLATIHKLKKASISNLDLARIYGGTSQSYTYKIDYVIRKMMVFGRILEDPAGMKVFAGDFVEFSERIRKATAREADSFRYDFPAEFACVGFIDGSLIQTSRPGGTTERMFANGEPAWRHFQDAFYSGFGKKHGLKTLLVLLPNGLISVCQPYQTIRHNDITSWNNSGIHEVMREICVNDHGGRQFFLFGDGIFNNVSTKHHLRTYYSIDEDNPNADKKQQNAAMSRMRSSVEHSIGSIKNVFPHVSTWKNFKILDGGARKAADMFLAATLLYNCKAVLYGNQTGSKFGYNKQHMPQSIQEYFDMLRAVE
ncbi:hypothetical protein TrCOL_g12177 [Triparma columacea]|uniref:DDE Tnp4 domain-containing protein n=1 Tax=Triparma columacea TaxID=722753 RepID=A0A9W7L4Z8_9STRA|nr:hypothetical protein TrCOL_g12177 [Triparma columacea]